MANSRPLSLVSATRKRTTLFLIAHVICHICALVHCEWQLISDSLQASQSCHVSTLHLHLRLDGSSCRLGVIFNLAAILKADVTVPDYYQ